MSPRLKGKGRGGKKRKIGSTISVNIGTQEDPNILKIGAQCSEKEKHKFMELFS
jgi:hypothetical protein